MSAPVVVCDTSSLSRKMTLIIPRTPSNQPSYRHMDPPDQVHVSPSISDVLSAIEEMLKQKDKLKKALQLIKDLEELMVESGEPPQGLEDPAEDPGKRLDHIATFLEKRKDIDISIVKGRVVRSIADPKLENIAKKILFNDRD